MVVSMCLSIYNYLQLSKEGRQWMMCVCLLVDTITLGPTVLPVLTCDQLTNGTLGNIYGFFRLCITNFSDPPRLQQILRVNRPIY